MKSSIFGKRKWHGMWMSILSIMIFAIVASWSGVAESVINNGIWSISSIYGVFVTGNFITHISKNKRGEKNDSVD